jgi:putative flippase GtrA
MNDHPHNISLPGFLERHRTGLRQIASFGAIGAFSTLAYLALFTLLRDAIGVQPANLSALVATAVANTAANRRLTFGVEDASGMARDQAAGLLALAVALAITSGSLASLGILAPHHGRLSELAVLVGANAVATLVRLFVLRFAIVGPRRSMTARTSTATLQTVGRTPR